MDAGLEPSYRGGRLALGVVWNVGLGLGRRSLPEKALAVRLLVAGTLADSTAAIVMVVGVLIFERTTIHYTTSYGMILIYNAIVPTVLGYWCWSRLLERMSVARASQLLMLSPGFALLVSATVLDEPLTATLIASSIFIVGGAVLSYRHSNK